MLIILNIGRFCFLFPPRKRSDTIERIGNIFGSMLLDTAKSRGDLAGLLLAYSKDVFERFPKNDISARARGKYEACKN